MKGQNMEETYLGVNLGQKTLCVRAMETTDDERLGVNSFFTWKDPENDRLFLVTRRHSTVDGVLYFGIPLTILRSKTHE